MKAYFILIFVLMPSICFSQIEGLGVFKINKTSINDMELFFQTKNLTRDSCNDNEIFFDKTIGSDTVLLEIFANKLNIDNSPTYSNYSKEVRVFFVNYLKISGIEIKDLYLTFLNGVLVKINTNSTTELTDALKFKYGKGTIKNEKKYINCRYRLTGSTVKLEENTYYTYWRNDNIKVYELLMSYYDSKCEEQYYSGFYAYDEIKNTIIEQKNEAERKKVEAYLKVKKSSQLSDL